MRSSAESDYRRLPGIQPCLVPSVVPRHPSARAMRAALTPARGDQPGARIDGDAAIAAVVGGEHPAQALDGAAGVRLAHAREGSVHVLKAEYVLQSRVDVVSVEDGLVHVVEAHRL